MSARARACSLVTPAAAIAVADGASVAAASFDAEIRKHGARPEREGPGVDYLLPYWLAVYLGVLPKP